MTHLKLRVLELVEAGDKGIVHVFQIVQAIDCHSVYSLFNKCSITVKRGVIC